MAYDDFEMDYGYMGEGDKPSGVLLALTAIPLLLDAAIYYLTDGFSVHPHFSHFIYMVVTLALAIIAGVAAVFAFLLAKDEEPEWGNQLPFKLVEGINMASLALTSLFIILLIYMYYLSPPK